MICHLCSEKKSAIHKKRQCLIGVSKVEQISAGLRRELQTFKERLHHQLLPITFQTTIYLSKLNHMPQQKTKDFKYHSIS